MNEENADLISTKIQSAIRDVIKNEKYSNEQNQLASELILKAISTITSGCLFAVEGEERFVKPKELLALIYTATLEYCRAVYPPAHDFINALILLEAESIKLEEKLPMNS